MAKISKDEESVNVLEYEQTNNSEGNGNFKNLHLGIFLEVSKYCKYFVLTKMRSPSKAAIRDGTETDQDNKSLAKEDCKTIDEWMQLVHFGACSCD